MRSTPRCYKWDRFGIQLDARQSPAIKVVNMEAEEATAVEAITRRLRRLCMCCSELQSV
jgi:hypothetical protein